MPYTSGPVLAAMQGVKDTGDRKNYLMRMRDRRMEDQASALEERKVAVAERKQEFEEQKTKRDYAAKQQATASRQAALKGLPPRPGVEAPPEAQVAWFNNASATMAANGYEDSAEQFRKISQEMYGQTVEGPSELATAESERYVDRSTEDVNYSRAELNRAEAGAIASGKKYAPKAGKPMSVVDQIKTDDAINSVAQESLFTAFPELTMDEEFDDANVATGNFTPAKLNGMSARWYVDTYRSWVDEAGVDEAKKQMEETNKVISSEDTAGMFGKDNSEEFIVPKGYIQELGMRLGHAPTDAEIIAAWMYNLGAFEAGS